MTETEPSEIWKELVAAVDAGDILQWDKENVPQVVQELESECDFGYDYDDGPSPRYYNPFLPPVSNQFAGKNDDDFDEDEEVQETLQVLESSIASVELQKVPWQLQELQIFAGVADVSSFVADKPAFVVAVDAAVSVDDKQLVPPMES